MRRVHITARIDPEIDRWLRLAQETLGLQRAETIRRALKEGARALVRQAATEQLDCQNVTDSRHE